MAAPDVVKVIGDLEAIGLDLVQMILQKDYTKAFDLAKQVISLGVDLKAAIPEIKALTANDAKAVLTAIISVVEEIIAKVKGVKK